MKTLLSHPHQTPPTWLRRIGRGWLAFALLALAGCLPAVAEEIPAPGETRPREQPVMSASLAGQSASTMTAARNAPLPACCTRSAPVPGRNPAHSPHYPRELFHIRSLGRRDVLKAFGPHAPPAPGSPTLFTLGVLLRP